MSPPPHTRSATPTQPPDEIRSKLRAFLDWKTVLFSCILLGAAGMRLWAGLATHTDVKAEHDFATSQAAAISRRIDENAKRLDTIEAGNAWRDSTLKGIADRLGVFAPPPPSAATFP